MAWDKSSARLRVKTSRYTREKGQKSPVGESGKAQPQARRPRFLAFPGWLQRLKGQQGF